MAEVKAAEDRRLLTTPIERLTQADRLELRRRAEEGDLAVLPQIRRLMDLYEQTSGDLILTGIGEESITSLIRQMSGADLDRQELYRRKVKALRANLTRPKSTAPEDLLIDRVIATWLQVQYFETIYFQSVGDLTIKQDAHQQYRVDRANHRHLAAIRALDQVRRLNLPTVQVNVGEKQLNVLQTGGGPGQQENLSAGSAPCLPG